MTAATAFGVGSLADAFGASAFGPGAFAAWPQQRLAWRHQHGRQGDYAIAGGAFSEADGENSIALGGGHNPASAAYVDAAADNGVAIGSGATVNSGAANSVALGAGSVADDANVVSVGCARRGTPYRQCRGRLHRRRAAPMR